MILSRAQSLDSIEPTVRKFYGLINFAFKLYVSQIRTLSRRGFTSHKFQVLYSVLSFSLFFSLPLPLPLPIPKVSHIVLFFPLRRNEISESFIFLTNCFLLRREKSLDRFSIPAPGGLREFPLGTRIFCMHRLRGGKGGQEESREETGKGVNTFPFGAVGAWMGKVDL